MSHLSHMIGAVGFWSNLFGGNTPAPATLIPSSPWSETDLTQITIETLWGDTTEFTQITKEVAQRVPGLKRALSVHLAMLSRVVFREYKEETLVVPQPTWYTQTASGISPQLRKMGMVQDLFWWGWTLLGAEKGPDGRPVDAIHVPFGKWHIDSDTGKITIDDDIPARYRELPIAIPFGMNGVLVDGIDTIRAARNIEVAHLDRIANPIAQTELHLTEDVEMSPKAKRKLAEQYNAGRQLKGGSTSVTPHNIEVKVHGQIPTDLFESGRNAIRLDLANHAYVPASVIEGAKNGSAGELEYNNAQTERNGIYDFGTTLFINAIEARLSMDDVCEPGRTVRGDAANILSVPTPTTSPALED